LGLVRLTDGVLAEQEQRSSQARELQLDEHHAGL
jgi:hypothetical protein